MAFQAMWVPGYVAAAQNVGGAFGTGDGPLLNYDTIPAHDYQDVVGFRQGFGVNFRGKAGRQVWFHFAIPTPVVIETRASIQRAFVLWTTIGESRLLSFHVWDGNRARLFQRDDINAQGNFDGGSGQPGTDPKLVEGRNMFTLAQPQVVFYGIGISVLIGFAPEDDVSEVFFSSAGADFTTG